MKKKTYLFGGLEAELAGGKKEREELCVKMEESASKVLKLNEDLSGQKKKEQDLVMQRNASEGSIAVVLLVVFL